MKMEVQQVAEATKLKSDQIRALEEGNYDYFTAPVYLRGSVRTYARLLKLDGVKLVAELDAELGASKKFADDLPAPARKKSALDSIMLLLSRLNWMWAAILIFIVVAVLGGGAIWRAWNSRTPSDPLKKLGPGLYQPAQPTGEILPLPTNAPGRGR